MSMTKKNDQTSYELVFITLEEKEDILKTISKLAEDAGGSITERQVWGKKTFTYPVKKKSSGYYFLWSLNFPKKSLKNFEKNLRFNEDILRYLLLSTE